MNTSERHAKIERLEFGDRIRVCLDSGDVLVIPYDYTSRLSRASKESLREYRLIGGGRGIHFPEIDEDISLEGIVRYKLMHDLMAS
jgi:hypothetical protein